MSRLWRKQVFFTLMEHGAIRVLDALTTLILIRAFTTAHFGLFSLYQSWVGILLLFFPALEQSFYRHYSSLKNEGSLVAELQAYKFFNFIKLLFAVGLVVALAAIPQSEPYGVRSLLLAFAFALPLSQSLYGVLREPLRFEMKQAQVAFIGALQRVVLLGALLFVWWWRPQNVELLCVTALGVYGLFALVWHQALGALLKELGFGAAQKTHFARRASLKRIFKVFTGTVVWIHISGIINQSTQTLDTFALGFNHLNLEELGLYSIALKSAGFFQILPVALVNSFGVYLGRQGQNPEAERRLTLKYTVLFFILCMGLFTVGVAGASPLLALLAKGKLTDTTLLRTILYFKYQLAGVLILCVSYPLSTYLGARAPLKKLFFFVFLPWMVLSFSIYMAAARTGALLTAQANVLVYLILFFLLAVFFVRPGRKA